MMRILLISGFLLILSGCGGGGSESSLPEYHSIPINPANTACSRQKNDAANACYDAYCLGCGGFGCLYCWSNCVYSSESTYYTCCYNSGCTQDVSGYIEDTSGNGVAGVKVTMDNMTAQYTDSYGFYAFRNSSGGTVIPSKQGLCFSPVNRSYTQDYKQHTYEDFIAKAACYTISGKITLSDGTIVTGVTVVLSGAKNATTVTNSSGYFSFFNLTSGSYTVTPAGVTVNPSSYSVTIDSANVMGQDFLI